MKLKGVLFSIFIVLIAASLTKGQNAPIGQWKDYLAYQQCSKICQGQNLMYCTSQSGIFSYNLGDNSIEKYNRVTGLSDIGTNVARFASYNNTLFIGYTDGNIDLMQNGQVVNIPDLKNSSIQGSKSINDIYFINNIAYVSCGQGIMQMDIAQDIILNTFFIGSNSSAINVHSLTVFNDSIFAATDNGIYKASLYDANLNNFYEWKRVSNHVLAPGKYNAIAAVGNTLYVNFSKLLTDDSLL